MSKAEAIPLVRFSSKPQEKGDSVRRQLSLSEKWEAANPGVRVRWDKALMDLGLSGWTGANRKKGDLGKFLAEVAAGKVARGTYLLLEDFDRFSREDPLDSLQNFSNLVKAGIRIVFLNDGSTFDASTDRNLLMLIVAKASAAWGYSQNLSKRLAPAWQEKRDQASKKKLSKTCPSWIVASGNAKEGTIKFAIDEAKKQVVLQIIQLSLDGLGTHQICNTLNKQKVRNISGRGKRWVRGSVIRLLRSRTLIGEYQPCSHHKAEGQPIKNYYPAILTEKEFRNLQACIDGRKTETAARNPKVANLFTGILWNIADQTKLLYVDSGIKKGTHYTYLFPQDGGTGFRYSLFESTFLRWCKELSPSELLATSPDFELAGLETERQATQTKLDKVRHELENDGDFQTLLIVAKKLETKLKALETELEALRIKATVPEAATLAETQDLITYLSGLEGEALQDARRRLRAQIKLLISQVWLMFKDGACYAEIVFRTGKKRRIIIAAGGTYTTVCDGTGTKEIWKIKIA